MKPLRATLQGSPHQTQTLGPYQAHATINGAPALIRWHGAVRPEASLGKGSGVMVRNLQNEWMVL